jgi:hypothetical protein
MSKRLIFPIPLLMALIAVSCGGQAGGQKNNQDEVHEMEIIPKVKEPLSDVVDTVGFPEESHGTPITGYQGYPEDDLVQESKDDDIVNFAGGADVDYYNDRGSDSDGY